MASNIPETKNIIPIGFGKLEKPYITKNILPPNIIEPIVSNFCPSSFHSCLIKIAAKMNNNNVIIPVIINKLSQPK